MMIVKKFSPEQHRNGQKAELFDPELRVVSATLYNFVIDKYNTLVSEYEALGKRVIEKEKQRNPFDNW
jgi:hypothetical protein